MDYIQLTNKNLDAEHICCAIANNRDCQVMSKKAWLRERLDEGLVFLKANVRGKCFIEYIPAESAFAPIDADGYMYIDCLWVSGQFKGHGYSDELMDKCIADSRAKGKKGLVALSSEKKRGFLADAAYLKHCGFSVVDTAEPYFQLMALQFDKSAPTPRFRSTHNEIPAGYTIYYTAQCPFTAKYVPLLSETAKQKKVLFQAILLDTAQAAQNAPCPLTTFSLYHNGTFVTHEILSVPKFEKLIAQQTEMQ